VSATLRRRAAAQARVALLVCLVAATGLACKRTHAPVSATPVSATAREDRRCAAIAHQKCDDTVHAFVARGMLQPAAALQLQRAPMDATWQLGLRAQSKARRTRDAVRSSLVLRTVLAAHTQMKPAPPTGEVHVSLGQQRLEGSLPLQSRIGPAGTHASAPAARRSGTQIASAPAASSSAEAQRERAQQRRHGHTGDETA
jgi:hypothetical protein